MTDAVAQLKEVHHATWATGDYAEVAKIVEEVPPDHLLARVGVEPGMEVLDVATGSGNVALKAAARGARVVGVDLTPELFDAARRRASEMGVEVEWVEGDAEDLPFEDGRFDRVLSTFGVMFTPRHDVTARELVRVCKPGGTIGVINWTAEGQWGRMFDILGRYLPPPPEFASPPPLWGDEDHVRRLFEDSGAELAFERHMAPLSFETVEHYVSFMETNYGPTIRAREALEPDGKWADCRAEIVELMEDMNVSTDIMIVDAEYLLTLARKPG